MLVDVGGYDGGGAFIASPFNAQLKSIAYNAILRGTSVGDVAFYLMYYSHF
jgi:hypothetical protein